MLALTVHLTTNVLASHYHWFNCTVFEIQTITLVAGFLSLVVGIFYGKKSSTNGTQTINSG